MQTCHSFSISHTFFSFRRSLRERICKGCWDDNKTKCNYVKVPVPSTWSSAFSVYFSKNYPRNKEVCELKYWLRARVCVFHDLQTSCYNLRNSIIIIFFLRIQINHSSFMSRIVWRRSPIRSKTKDGRHRNIDPTKANKASLVSNQEVRDESNYYQYWHFRKTHLHADLSASPILTHLRS